ncbi:hypothetical protein KVF89_19010 [Nocardioides carbamazepini]|uniref:hypothetical protein n=1 Tax=Nocardioides carbamazepini TaxID=2854259 RepID=UPI00214A005E|nr:hypothetical protein [Nocardioides carbamazepini]MCR1784642.1 hypothetical protein [Nocardioides carbamazepini]
MVARGWATASFQQAVRRAFLCGIVVWTPVVIAAYFAGPERHQDPTLMVVVNVALLVVAAAAAVLRRIPARVVFVLQCAVFVFDWAQTAGPSTPFAVASYQIFIFAAVAQGLLLRRRSDLVLSILCCLLAAVVLGVATPDYGVRVSISAAVTGPLAIVVGRPGLEPLLRFARSVDANHDASVRALVRLDTQTATLRRAAEEQRQVHDTAINTLAAVARGGSAVADVEAVRVRCRADTLVLERLISASAREASASASPEEPLARRSIDVSLPGLAGAALAARWTELPVGVRSALGGAIGELVTNTEKHAGVGEAAVDIRDEGDGIRIVVRDHGRGFAPTRTPERGLATSVRARLAEEGISLDLQAAPGEGVRAEMVWRPGAGRGDEPAEIRGDVNRIRMIGALLMSSLVAAGGVVLGASNHPGELTPDYLLAALVVASTGLVWRSWRRRERLTRAATAALVVVAPIAFLASGVSVDFGMGYNLAWQAVAPVGPLFILVAGARSIRTVAFGVLTYVAVGVTAALVLADTPTARATTSVVLLTGLVWLAGWCLFNHQLRRIASRGAREHEMAVRADEAAEVQAAAALIRARWRLAGIASATDLLRELGGSMDPASAEAQRRSGREETYLRQVVLLAPDLVHVGAWFCQALLAARERGVDLQVRAGTRDVAAADAETLGIYLVEATSAVAPGATVIVSLFEEGEGLQFRLVADDPRVVDLARERDWDPELEPEIRRYGEQVLVRVGPMRAEDPWTVTAAARPRAGRAGKYSGPAPRTVSRLIP